MPRPPFVNGRAVSGAALTPDALVAGAGVSSRPNALERLRNPLRRLRPRVHSLRILHPIVVRADSNSTGAPPRTAPGLTTYRRRAASSVAAPGAAGRSAAPS